jgi:[acyl-carrier-protein] S-malonyltransferase
MSQESITFLFPGQGSQAVGMGKALASQYHAARLVFEEADDILGFALSELAWEGPEDELNDTINTQPALLVHSVAALRVLQEYQPDLRPAFVAGHSMGELSGLVASQALAYPDALKLVRVRGEQMKAAGELSPGGMAAILGLDLPSLNQVCLEASSGEQIVQIANDNCPGQVVISGETAALQRALELAVQAGAKRAIPLAVSIAAHSPLMIHAQAGFNQAVEESPLTDPVIPLVGNVTAQPLTSVASIKSDLRAQLLSRVRWTESIQYMRANGITHFLELGSGSVLTGLLKRIDRQAQGLSLGAPEDYTTISGFF